MLDSPIPGCIATILAFLAAASAAAQTPLPAPPGSIEIGRFVGWQVFKGKIGDQHDVCTIASKTTEDEIVLTIRHGTDSPNYMLLGFVRTDGKNWSDSELSVIPTRMWINSMPGDEDKLMVTKMRNVAVEHESSAALSELATMSANKTALWISFDFPSTGGAVAVGLDGFSSALASFRKCETQAGLPTGVDK